MENTRPISTPDKILKKGLSLIPSQPLPWQRIAACSRGELWLLIAPFRIIEIERIIIPRLALRGPVHIIVGGHSYDVDGILRSLRKLTPDAAGVRKRIRQRRAPTAFQLRALLKKTPDTTDPVIVLNFLINYLDDDEEIWKSKYLLEESITELQRLGRRAPVVITVRPPRADAGSHRFLFDRLRDVADQVIEFVPPVQPVQRSFLRPQGFSKPLGSLHPHRTLK